MNSGEFSRYPSLVTLTRRSLAADGFWLAALLLLALLLPGLPLAGLLPADGLGWLASLFCAGRSLRLGLSQSRAHSGRLGSFRRCRLVGRGCLGCSVPCTASG